MEREVVLGRGAARLTVSRVDKEAACEIACECLNADVFIPNNVTEVISGRNSKPEFSYEINPSKRVDFIEDERCDYRHVVCT